MSGRGKSQKSLELIDAAVRILEEIRPATVRAVCYRLFTEKRIPSMAKNNTNTVSRHLVYAREAGIVPWEWIVDETRQALEWATYSNPNAFLESMRDRYCRDAWQDQPNRVEVWSEKSTIKGTLLPILEQYGVTFRSFHGHTSATAIYEACEESRRRHRCLTALYVGDWDPSGLHMSELDLPERISRYDGEIVVWRVAINGGDTDPSAGIPSFDPSEKLGDPRHKWFMSAFGTQCFELDALSPVILRDRVEGAILGLLDVDAWNHAQSLSRNGTC